MDELIGIYGGFVAFPKGSHQKMALLMGICGTAQHQHVSSIRNEG
jgi:hypothetical protein